MNTTRPALAPFAALLLACTSALAPSRALAAPPGAALESPGEGAAHAADAPRELSEEEARRLLPRADLSGLNGEQRASLLDVAGDTFDYAGCNSTLAACLRADMKDRHAQRMAKVAALMLQDGMSASQTIFYLEQYYSSFDKAKRQKLRADDCGLLGDPKAPIAVVEFSDYQCPHCATAVKPLHDLVDAEKGKVKLCSKYFPLPGHARAVPASGCAEYARQKGKFWEMSDMLFARQDELDDTNLKVFARQLKLDGEEMLKQVYAGKFDKTIEAHKKEGVDAGVHATPALYFNGRFHTLPIKLEYLIRSAEDEIEWQRNGGGWDKE